jgi:phosphate:Na+ symporter
MIIQSNQELKKRKILLFAFSGLLSLFLILYPSLIEIGTGIAILLFGIINLEQGFKIFTEGPLRDL